MIYHFFNLIFSKFRIDLGYSMWEDNWIVQTGFAYGFCAILHGIVFIISLNTWRIITRTC